MNTAISDKKIVIATHYVVYGASHALREYFMLKKVRELLFIAHPLEANNGRSYYEYIFEDVVNKKQQSFVRFRLGAINYFIDALLSIWWMHKKPGKSDLWIGVDSLNAIVGLFLRMLHKVDRVIYYTIDYVPTRFENKLMNSFYHWLDSLCVKYSDQTWNVSPRIAEGREKMHGFSANKYPQKVVPIGVWFDRVKRLSTNQVKRHQVLFVGHLLKKQGVQYLLNAIPRIIQSMPDFHLLVVGGGPYENSLKQKTQNLNINKYVTFTGWIKNRRKLDTIMADSAIGVALYDKKIDNFTYYADPTKLKDYLSAGLPIILSDVPYNAYEIEKSGCGVVVNPDNQDELVKAINDLLNQPDKLYAYKQNAVAYARRLDWKLIFDSALTS